ncbi:MULTISPECIES: GntR family transcriptional regulator [unclassified Leucobacter]|uniref:GntR family transcriptional regulator n=1 Tax=unclassified Leucobacter TaxID=2621730 RepID=UPI00165E6EA4|nr:MULTISPECIES: GntR family transcriptional regulator [unclassified Leucobacter]MBC9935817.1 GntR family transcriptional regulator [Leucobacter sp. cx-87]
MNTTSEQSATDTLRTLILSLELMPGMGLSERGLEEALGASRTPIRAALARLEVEGLTRRSGRSWQVAPIDLTEIRAAMEFREALEIGAVALATERADAAEVVSIQQRLEAGSADEDEAAGLQGGTDFHLSLAALSGNPFFVDAMRDVFVRLARTRWLEVRTQESRAQARREHQAIATAIQSGDTERATELVILHTRGTRDRLLATLEGERLRLRGRGLAIVESPS